MLAFVGRILTPQHWSRRMIPTAYQKPTVTRFGDFRALTAAGCTGGATDGRTFYGETGPSVGDTPRITSGTTDYCFSSRGSR